MGNAHNILNGYLLTTSFLHFQMFNYLSFPHLTLNFFQTFTHKNYFQIPPFLPSLSYFTKLSHFHFLPSFYVYAKIYQIMTKYKKSAKGISEFTKKYIFWCEIRFNKVLLPPTTKVLNGSQNSTSKSAYFLFTSL